MSRLAWLNGLPGPEAREALFRCCGCTPWAERVAAERPFASEAALFAAADRIWGALSSKEHREAFSHHPRIGDVSKLREKFASTSAWAGEEQAGVRGAAEETLQALARGNGDYEKRFGFVFLVCATGKSAAEMLALLRSRIHHDLETELEVAAGEQAKITRIRLEKLLKP